MTALEKKLVSLKYGFLHGNMGQPNYGKISDYDKRIEGVIVLNNDRNKIVSMVVRIYGDVRTQQDIDNIQIAYNNLTQDIKELGGEIK